MLKSNLHQDLCWDIVCTAYYSNILRALHTFIFSGLANNFNQLAFSWYNLMVILKILPKISYTSYWCHLSVVI